MYVLLEFWQKIMAIPIMNPLSWFMIVLPYYMILYMVELSSKVMFTFVQNAFSLSFQNAHKTHLECMQDASGTRETCANVTLELRCTVYIYVYNEGVVRLVPVLGKGVNLH